MFKVLTYYFSIRKLITLESIWTLKNDKYNLSFEFKSNV